MAIEPNIRIRNISREEFNENFYLRIKAEYNNKPIEIVMARDDAARLGREADKCYYYDDVCDYFDDGENAYKPAIFEDKDLLEAITEKYSDLRDDAAGDEHGMSWPECLNEAVKHFSDDLRKYTYDVVESYLRDRYGDEILENETLVNTIRDDYLMITCDAESVGDIDKDDIEEALYDVDYDDKIDDIETIASQYDDELERYDY